eukprot:TRINITY_DN7324_c0_g1_i1.p1 TRINITY_DN7324_c0_g1~~TRINITY_DN7324_c0_g1_i1.p1  ORF type:complete len:362 (-),score=59.77 TRINITY_DN7324_c0_g1_i1:30-1079(-)
MALMASLSSCFPWLRLQFNRVKTCGTCTDTVEAERSVPPAHVTNACATEAQSKISSVRAVDKCSPRGPRTHPEESLGEQPSPKGPSNFSALDECKAPHPEIEHEFFALKVSGLEDRSVSLETDLETLTLSSVDVQLQDASGMEQEIAKKDMLGQEETAMFLESDDEDVEEGLAPVIRPSFAPVVDVIAQHVQKTQEDDVKKEMLKQERELAALPSQFDEATEQAAQSEPVATKTVVQKHVALKSSLRSRKFDFRVQIGDTKIVAFLDPRFAHRATMTLAQLEQAAMAAELRRRDRELENILREAGLMGETLRRRRHTKAHDLQLDRPKKPIKHVASWLGRWAASAAGTH